MLLKPDASLYLTTLLNDVPDEYSVTTRFDAPPLDVILFSEAKLQLVDLTMAAISDVSLPATPPDLTHWDFTQLIATMMTTALKLPTQIRPTAMVMAQEMCVKMMPTVTAIQRRLIVMTTTLQSIPAPSSRAVMKLTTTVMDKLMQRTHSAMRIKNSA